MKRSLAIILVICMMAGLFCACGNKTKPAFSESTDGGASTQETVELSFTIHDPVTSAKTQLYQQMADKVFEESNGTLKVTIYVSGTLVSGTDVAEGVRSDTADMGWLFIPYFTNQFPLTEVVQTPLEFGDVHATTKVLKQVFDDYPEVQAEWANYKVLNLYAQPANYLFTNKPIRTAADLAGLNIRTSSTVGTSMIGGWGAAVMTYTPGDIYEAINKNAIDGFTFDYSGVKSFKLYEVIDYVTDTPIFAGVFCTAMNLDKWNSLSAEHQAILDKHFGWSLAETFADLFYEDAVAGKKLCEENAEILTLTEEEIATFAVDADKYTQGWIEQNTTDSFDAGEFLETVKGLYEGYLAS